LLTAEQLRAARALLRWDQPTVAERAGISVETIKRLERMDGILLSTRVGTLESIVRVFRDAGVEFTNGEEPGVKLKKRR
jgi:transcriptional regulator with XRE-family HTH domain